jgi:putative DNA-invertase from lambdoid prophage Rac
MSKTHPTPLTVRAAVYARVSTFDQEPENQLLELRRYVEARGWTTAEEYVDRLSGAKDRRPGLDRLLHDAKRRRFDVLVVWRLDRLGRSVRHLVNFISELSALGIGFASLSEGIDTNTPSGRLQLHILSALAEFERERIRERVLSGLARARAQGTRLGRPRQAAPTARVQTVSHLTVDAAARLLGVSRSTLKRWRQAVQKSSAAEAPVSPALADVRPVR